jgi:hypothetical protein
LKLSGFFGGEERCTVLFLPRTVAVQPDAEEKYCSKFAQVLELLSTSEEGVAFDFSLQNMGAASFRMLEEIQELK